MIYKIRSHNEFKKFFNEFFPPVYNLMKKYTRDEELARDLTQEAFLKLYECKEEFETLENAKAFLYTIARNLHRNYLKHLQIQSAFQNNISEEEEEKDYLKEMTLHETLRILHTAILKLPPKTRRIIELNLQGKNNAEVAEILSISVNTVKSMKKSAYLALRKYIDKDVLWLILLFLKINS